MRRNLYVVAVMLFIVNLMLTGIVTLAFNRGYYTKVYHRLETAETIGISEKELDEATTVLLDYIKDKRPNLDLKVEFNGRSVEMFNQKEKDHMVDVKELYLTVINFRNITTIFIAIMLVISLGAGDYLDVRLNRDNLRMAMLCLGAILGAVALFALIDFRTFWITFHEIVFTNDLWLLDPNVDRLIMMVPEPFFMGLVYRIIGAVAAILVACGAVYAWLDRRVKKYDSRRSL